MIYNGLEFGAFFEVPVTSPCYQILRGVNPVLQMVFTFMQMYFIFMNSRVSASFTVTFQLFIILSVIQIMPLIDLYRQLNSNSLHYFFWYLNYCVSNAFHD